MGNALKKIRDSFASELIVEGDVWRILRRGTLVDLIKLSYFDFQKDHNEKCLINIINHSVKILLFSKLKQIEVEGSLDELASKFNRESELILRNYDLLFEKLKPSFENYASSNLYDLNTKIQYIKVIKDLELDSFSPEVFEEIIAIAFNILNTN